MTLAEQIESLSEPSQAVDDAIWLAVTPGGAISNWSYEHKASGRKCQVREVRIEGGRLQTVPCFTKSLDAVRALGGLVVFASDIGADGLALVKLVSDTSTTPIAEYTGIASTLECAWLAAALRMKGL